MKRLVLAGLAALIALSSAPSARADAGAPSGFIWEPNYSPMSAPTPTTHSAWPDRIVAMASDGARIHALWDQVGGARGVVYRSSTDGATWSAPEALGNDQTSTLVTTGGYVYTLGDNMILHRRDASGTWTVSGTPVYSVVSVVRMAAAPDGRLWVVYSTDALGASSRTLMAMSRDPATLRWSSAENTGTVLRSGDTEITLTVSPDGTPWVVNAAAAAKVQVQHRGSSGWLNETVVEAPDALSSVRGVALGARADGSLVLLYWDQRNVAQPALKWATRASDAWTDRGALFGRSAAVVGRARIAHAPNGDDVAVWEESRTYSDGLGYRVVSRLSPSGVWSQPTILGSFPRGLRTGISLAFAPSGRALVATEGMTVNPDMGGVIATERADGSWSDESPVAASVQIDGPSFTAGLEFAAAPNDAQYVAWYQQTGDGLGLNDGARRPHIAFAVRRKDRTWSTPQAIEGPTAWRPPTVSNGYDVEPDVAGVASDRNGAAYVIWRDLYAAPDLSIATRLLGRYRAADGTWSAVEQLPITWNTSRGLEYRPQMSFDASGAFWVMSAFGQEARRAPDGAWTTQPSLLPTPVFLDGLRFTTAPDGTQFAQYATSVSTGGGEVLLSRRGTTGDWSAPERIDTTSGGARSSGGLVVVGGALVSAWSEQVPGKDQTGWRGMLATKSLTSGAWSAPKTFGTEGLMKVSDVAVMDDGSWWVVYVRCPRKEDGNTICQYYPSLGSAVRAIRRTPAGVWQQPVFVSMPGGSNATHVDDSEYPRMVGSHQPLIVWGTPFANVPRLGPGGASFSTGFPDASVSLTESSNNLNAGDCVTTTLHAISADGHPLSLLEVAWLSSLGGAGQTIYNGESSLQFCSTKAQSVTVTVLFTQGYPTVSDVLSWAPGPPAQITIRAPASAVVGQPVDLAVTVTDRFLNGVRAPLAWTLSSGPGELKDAAAESAADGSAHARLSSTKVGSSWIDVSVPGTDIHAVAKVSWNPGPPVGLRFDAPPTTMNVGSLATLRVVEVDEFGNDSPTIGATLAWSWVGQGAFGGAPVTDSRGSAMAVGTSALAGDSIVTATLRSSGRSASTKLTWR